jgi:ribosomal protein L37E
MQAPSFKLVQKGKRNGIVCGKCGQTSWDWRHARNRYCPNCQLSLETTTQKAWREYKEKPEHQTSALPFPPRRKTLFDKLHDSFLALVTLGGIIYILVNFVIWLFEKI